MEKYKRTQELYNQMEKEVSNGWGYVGVEEGNWHEPTDQENIELLFFRITWERDVLAQDPEDYTNAEFWGSEGPPFKSEYYVELHRKRLAKFWQKHKDAGTFKEGNL